MGVPATMSHSSPGSLNFAGQVAAVVKLHHRQEGTRLGLVGVIRHDDIRMAEAGDRFDFPLKVGKDPQDHK
jgi:hypothetical protein